MDDLELVDFDIIIAALGDAMSDYKPGSEPYARRDRILAVIEGERTKRVAAVRAAA